MPNGHGGKPRFLTPFLMAVAFVVVVRAPSTIGPRWIWLLILGVLAGLFGWRLAYDLHMRHADEYSGAYTSADERQQAQSHYRVRAVIYAIISLALACVIMWWRGFFGSLNI
jgi:hypothetical protein